MSILNAMAAQASQNTATPGAKAKRPPAEFWVNIGITLPTGQFIKLPFNLPLDDMSKLELRGQNQEWLQEAQVRNALLDVLKQQAGQLDAGGSTLVPELQVQLFRRSTDAAPDESENPLMAALLSQFGSK